MQNNYGVSDVTDSWGEKENLMAYDNLNNFFRTGLTSITSVSVNSGNDRLQTYFSYANTTGRGILNENKLSKHNINLRDKTIYQGDGNAISLMDGIKEEKDASEELLDHMLLNSLLGTLEEKERDLLRLRYFEDLTQVQVAKQLDMTQVQVSRMEKKILGKLRERL